MRISKTTRELYSELCKMPDLHSMPEIEGETLVWKLYSNTYIRACCDSYDTCIEIISTSPHCPSTHWHPDEADMLNELYALGKKGNILVLKRFLMGTDVFYIGEPEKYRFNKNRKWHFGRLFYLEQNQGNINK